MFNMITTNIAVAVKNPQPHLTSPSAREQPISSTQLQTFFENLTIPQSLGGVTGAYLTAWLIGPVAALGFAGGSCIGYVASTVFFWRSTEALAMKAYDDYPQLMMLHLFRNYRTMGFDRVPVRTAEERGEFRRKVQGSLALRCLLMAAWHTASPAIEVSELML